MSKHKMSELAPVVRFFDKIVEWLGLSRNAGSILAAMYLEKYDTDEKLSLEEIADETKYSRSNVALNLSQLESMGFVYGEPDSSQTGRGRRRILYHLSDNMVSPFSWMIRILQDRLNNGLKDVNSLKDTYSTDSMVIDRMLIDFEEEMKAILDRMTELPIKKVEI